MGTKLAITIVAAGVWSSALHFRARLRGAVLVMNAIMRAFVIWVPPACAGVLLRQRTPFLVVRGVGYAFPGLLQMTVLHAR